MPPFWCDDTTTDFLGDVHVCVLEGGHGGPHIMMRTVMVIAGEREETIMKRMMDRCSWQMFCMQWGVLASWALIGRE